MISLTKKVEHSVVLNYKDLLEAVIDYMKKKDIRVPFYTKTHIFYYTPWTGGEARLTVTFKED